MWPFDLRGPEFLLVYVALGAAVLLVTFLLRHAGEPADPPKVNLSDPYQIAFLRGGKNEALRVATMSLIDRGVLLADGSKITATETAFGKAASPFEQIVVRHFNPSAEAKTLFKMKDADPQMNQYENELTRLGLLPDEEQKDARLMRMAVALAVLLIPAMVKLFVALTTGHFNVGFLIFLAILFTVVAVKMSRPRRTRAGDRMVKDLKTLFDSLKQRGAEVRSGASPTEFALMAAVFGMSTVPEAKKLFPQAGGSGCGSSCGSSSGDSGSSSCGGGGCGGCGGG
jgi:uncharacterized protein (TIGR04222 family)